MTKSLTIIVSPNPLGQSFNVILAELTDTDDMEKYSHFELTILGKRDNIQGDMVLERLEDVVNPHLRRIANDLDLQLKQLRRKQANQTNQ